MTREPPLDFGEPLAEDPATLDQPGRSDLPLVACGCCCGDLLVDPFALFAGRGHPLGGPEPLVLQDRHTGDQLGHPGGVAPDPLLQLGPVAADLFELGPEQVAVAGHPLATDPGGLVRHLVAVVAPNRIGGRLAAGLDFGTRTGALFGRSSRFAGRHLGPVARFVDHGGRDDSAAGANPPARL